MAVQEEEKCVSKYIDPDLFRGSGLARQVRGGQSERFAVLYKVGMRTRRRLLWERKDWEFGERSVALVCIKAENS